MFKIVVFVILFLLILCIVLFAQDKDLDFLSSVDKTEISIGEALNFKITLKGNFKDASKIELPKLEEDFEIISKVQSEKISWQKGKGNKEFIYNIVLLAKKQGSITIDAAKLKVGLKTYTTEPIEITVKAKVDKDEFHLEPEKKLPVDEGSGRITL